MNNKKEIKNRLSDLDVDEISIVTRGANKKKFSIFKSGETRMDKDQIVKAILEGNDFNPSFDQILKDAFEKVEKEDFSKEDKSLLEASLQVVHKFKDCVPVEVLKQIGWQQIEKAEGTTQPKEAGCDDKKPKGSSVMKDGTLDTKALPEEVQTHIESIKKELEEEKGKNLEREALMKAAEYKNLGVETKELAEIFKELGEKAPEQLEKVEKTLKDLDARLEPKKEEPVKKDDEESKKEEPKAEDKTESVEEIKKSIDDLETKLKDLETASTEPKSESTKTTEDVKKEDDDKSFWHGVL